MTFTTHNVLGWTGGALLLIAASAQPAAAAWPVTPNRPTVPPAYRPANPFPQRPPTVDLTIHRNRMPGSDWWRIYPWSPYNAWNNRYWYPPYNPNYPYPPDEAYPYYPYPVPPPTPLPFPGGGIGSAHR
jgi:hypothetical protein